MPKVFLALAVGLILCAAVAAAYQQTAKARRGLLAAEAMTGGDAEAGRLAMQKYGCNACHTIPGVADARALVGPPLSQIASRVYIAGVLPNTPENLMRWIRNPPGVDPRTAMPNLGVNQTDARDISAYLYSLE